MSKEKVNIPRYYLIQSEGEETVYFNNPLDYEKFLQNIKKYNDGLKVNIGKSYAAERGKPNPYLIGNISPDIHGGTYVVNFTKYRKLTEASFLKELDTRTTQLEGEYNLKLFYGLDTSNKRPIQIGYRANGDIRTWEILYKDNKNFIKKEYIRDEYVKRSTSKQLLNKLIDNETIKSDKEALEDLDRLARMIRTYGYHDTNSNKKNAEIAMYVFVSRYTNHEKGTAAYTNLRRLAMVLKSYMAHEKYIQEQEEKRKEEARRRQANIEKAQEKKKHEEALKRQLTIPGVFD